MFQCRAVRLTSDEGDLVFDIEQLSELEVLIVVGPSIFRGHVVLLLRCRSGEVSVKVHKSRIGRRDEGPIAVSWS